MTVIGITGPTGAGKTTALRELEKLGGCVLDTDALYHELLESDTPIILSNGKETMETTIAELLPMSFGMEDLA